MNWMNIEWKNVMIVRLYFLRFMLCYPLRFPHGNDVRFFFSSSCLFVHSGVQHILCCNVGLFFFVLCTLCCQCLWIVHFWLPLQYSLTFIVFVLCTLCCQSLWIVHFWLPLRVASVSGLSTSDCPFVLPVSLDCPLLIAPSVFSNVYCTISIHVVIFPFCRPGLCISSHIHSWTLSVYFPVYICDSLLFWFFE